ncbi:MAG: hypothetical protein ABWY01_00475, partial [Pseudoxanthomonas sp.]
MLSFRDTSARCFSVSASGTGGGATTEGAATNAGACTGDGWLVGGVPTLLPAATANASLRVATGLSTPGKTSAE